MGGGDEWMPTPSDAKSDPAPTLHFLLAERGSGTAAVATPRAGARPMSGLPGDRAVHGDVAAVDILLFGAWTPEVHLGDTGLLDFQSVEE